MASSHKQRIEHNQRLTVFIYFKLMSIFLPSIFRNRFQEPRQPTRLFNIVLSNFSLHMDYTYIKQWKKRMRLRRQMSKGL